MKNWRKVILFVLCFSLIFGVTACGARDNNRNDNTINDATNHTDRNDTSNGMGNAIDNVGNAVGDGINAIGNGVENVTDDLTGHDNNVSQNKTTKP